MFSRRAFLLTGIAIAAGTALAGCGSSDQSPPPQVEVPNYAGKGEATVFEGTWVGGGWASDWQFDVQDGVFSGVGEGRGLSSWTGRMTGFIRTDHTIEGTAVSGSEGKLYKVGGTWPRLTVYGTGGPIGVIRLTRVS